MSERQFVLFYRDEDGDTQVEFHESIEWMVEVLDPRVVGTINGVHEVIGYFDTEGGKLTAVDVEQMVADAKAEQERLNEQWDPKNSLKTRPYTVRVHGPDGITATVGTYILPEHAESYEQRHIPAALNPEVVLREGARS